LPRFGSAQAVVKAEPTVVRWDLDQATVVPNASNVKYTAGQVIPNAVLAKVGTGGKVCIYTSAATDLVVDVNGFVPTGQKPTTLTPARLFESRPSSATVGTFDGRFVGGGRIAAGTTTQVLVAGLGGVPSNATAVMLNPSAVGPSAAGYLTVFPCGTDVPNASNVNYTAGQVIPNAAFAKVGTGGQVCVFSSADTDLVIDANAHV
jgi:hypothetical protein